MSKFYGLSHLTLAEKKTLFTDSKQLSYRFFVDILDCTVSIARRPIDMTFEEVMAKLVDDCHCVFIDRGRDFITSLEYFEVGFCTMNRGADYFLFLHLHPEYANSLIEKYELK